MGSRIRLQFELECLCGCGTKFLRHKLDSKHRFVGNHGAKFCSGIMDSIKIGNPCGDCGRFFPVECMDFDHCPNETKFREVAMIKNAQQMLDEIAKCDLVCACCHRTRTVLRRYHTSSY